MGLHHSSLVYYTYAYAEQSGNRTCYLKQNKWFKFRTKEWTTHSPSKFLKIPNKYDSHVKKYKMKHERNTYIFIIQSTNVSTSSSSTPSSSHKPPKHSPSLSKIPGATIQLACYRVILFNKRKVCFHSCGSHKICNLTIVICKIRTSGGKTKVYR